jgi:NADH dehydrogenase [ubiquinone] 1 alpha subcomplex assembly factor 5
MEKPSGADHGQIFDRNLVRRHRERVLRRLKEHDFLLTELTERLVDRLDDIARRFPLAADLSAWGGTIAKSLERPQGGERRGGVKTLIRCDLSQVLLAGSDGSGPRVVLSEEALPFRPGSLDLVLSVMGLHWVNDLPGALLQIRQALKPDGLFLAVLLGGETLVELRHCLTEAEASATGGVSPRVSPMVGLQDAAHLLQRAGFALPVADTETIMVTYADVLALMRDLRGMGEGNALGQRLRRPTRRAVIAKTVALYTARHAEPDGRIRATFQAIFLAGWAPDDTQQKPARRGSGEIHLGAALANPPRPS